VAGYGKGGGQLRGTNRSENDNEDENTVKEKQVISKSIAENNKRKYQSVSIENDLTSYIRRL